MLEIITKGSIMNRIVLGAALASVFVLPAIGADIPAATKATSAEHARLACHWVGRDRTLRPLRYTASPAHRTTTPEPHVVVSRAPAPAPAPAAEPARRPIARMAVVLGVGF
jgi:hypothetical protein